MSEHTASYPFPVLGPERMDYAESCCYDTSEWSVMSGEVRLLHRVEGNSLVSDMLEQGNAQFGCVVVLRATMYRKIFRCTADKQLSVRQQFTLDEGYRSVEAPKFMPVVVYKGDEKSIKAGGSHGVHEFWLGQKFKLYKGAILARGAWHQVNPGHGHLLRLKPREDILDGSIEVELSPSGGGYFLVYVSRNFYNSITRAKSKGSLGEEKALHLNSILTHALSAGLEKLVPIGEETEAYENFQALKQALEDKNEPTWLSEDFNACRAASVYLPHCLESNSNQDDDDNE